MLGTPDTLARTHPPSNRGELAGLGAALVILAAVMALAYRSIDAAGETLGWVEAAQGVSARVDEVSAAYARAAAGRRAYVVTGDATQLADNAGADARLDRAVEGLRASLSGDPAQLHRLDSLAKVMAERIAALDVAVARHRADPSAGETAEALGLTARVRAAREELTSAENAILVERDTRTRRDIARTKVAEVVGTLASFAILLLAFRRLLQEVTARRESERALRGSEAFLESIVENLPDMVFVKDANELRFERMNRAGEALLGMTQRDLFGKSDFDFFPVEQATAFQARDRETLAGRVVIDIPEEPILTPGGERWLHTKKVPVLDEHDVPKFLLGISEDITERRAVAAQLKAATDSMEAANQELEAFSYSVAHDLRAPLRAIDGFSLALEEDCAEQLDEEGRHHLKRVRAAAHHMSLLIDALLGLSRISRGELHRSRVDVTRLVGECGARLRAAEPLRRVEIVVSDGLEADGDPRLLAVLVDNLVGNAWKFTRRRPEGRVEVGRTSGPDGPTYFVRDNGAGFDPTYAGKLFGAFQRLHTTAEFEGSGIGLATVKRIVSRHGGRVWAEGEVDKGATFYFTL